MLLLKTTDCINSMITGVFMGSNSDCSDNNLNKEQLSVLIVIHPLVKMIFLEFETQNNKTSDFLAINHGLVKKMVLLYL